MPMVLERAEATASAVDFASSSNIWLSSCTAAIVLMDFEFVSLQLGDRGDHLQFTTLKLEI